MPLPSPKKDQEQEEFISACMGNSTMLKEYPKQDQRAAICYNQWKRAKKKKDEGKASSVNFDDCNDLGPFIVIYTHE